MRRTFADVLREGNLDIENEYSKLYSMMYDKLYDGNTLSLYDIINERFSSFYFRETCLSLEEFDKTHGFNFVPNPLDFDIQYLVTFCEYFQNMLIGLQYSVDYLDIYCRDVPIKMIMEQIRRVIDAIGYMETGDGRFTIFVEKSPAAIAVAESTIIPNDLSNRILEYNHYSLQGNIETKKQIIISIANILEPKRKELDRVASSLCSVLFFAFNNMNLRHNNVDADSKNYISTIAEMDVDDLENWYDEIYQMCLLSVLELEQADRKKKFDELKAAIEKRNH